MARPKDVCVTCVIDTEVDDKIESIAKKNGRLKSAVINDALKAYIGKKPSVADLS
jgi:predicted transcriptional regulator